MAKRPELLILDEPAASLDPIARRDFLDATAEVVAEHGTSVVFSSHLVGDLERICDYLVILVASRVKAAGPVADLLARLPKPVALEDLVLAYLREPEVAA
jgi:ABC-2 type transport system ATP-binding protein